MNNTRSGNREKGDSINFPLYVTRKPLNSSACPNTSSPNFYFLLHHDKTKRLQYFIRFRIVPVLKGIWRQASGLPQPEFDSNTFTLIGE